MRDTVQHPPLWSGRVSLFLVAASICSLNFAELHCLLPSVYAKTEIRLPHSSTRSPFPVAAFGPDIGELKALPKDTVTSQRGLLPQLLPTPSPTAGAPSPGPPSPHL